MGGGRGGGPLYSVVDPRIRTTDLRTVSGSISCSVRQWLLRCQPKICFLSNCAYLHQSSKIKINKKLQNSRNQGFSSSFLPDNGRIRTLTNNYRSESWKPKNLRILRIRIHNNASLFKYYFSSMVASFLEAGKSLRMVSFLSGRQ